MIVAVVIVEVLVVMVEVWVVEIVVMVVVGGVSEPKRFIIHSPPQTEFGSPGQGRLHPP